MMVSIGLDGGVLDYTVESDRLYGGELGYMVGVLGYMVECWVTWWGIVGLHGGECWII